MSHENASLGLGFVGGSTETNLLEKGLTKTEGKPSEKTEQKTEVKEVVTKDWTIGDVVKKYPSAVEVMLSHGLHCIGCSVSYWETLEQGAMGHGMTREVFDDMMKKLNQKISEDSDINPNDPVSITSAAAEKIKQLIVKEGKSYGLRLGVTAGGCSGYSYAMNFAESPATDDVSYEIKGVKIFIPNDSKAMLEGVKIDYVDALQGAGFKISNPNASHTCGCGSSFG
ncbi:MAG: iron-sulfur cluster assembly accessory protein [archaeon]|nr:iron-sulfur cluster assembly accessory protein [archaeon]